MQKKDSDLLMFIQTIQTPLKKVSNQAIFDSRYKKESLPKQPTPLINKEIIKEEVVINEDREILILKIRNIINANQYGDNVLSDIILETGEISGFIKSENGALLEVKTEQEIINLSIDSINDVYIRTIRNISPR